MTPKTPSASTWLRWAGAAIVVGSGVAYLVEGWAHHDVLWREVSWAALTVLLTSFGLMAARRLGDASGARIALALGAATIPVHFAEVGGAYYAYVERGMGTRLRVLAAALVLLPLLPILALGLAALVRAYARSLSVALFVLSASLLLPTRDPDWIAALVMGELLVLGALELWFWRDARLKTLEGGIARALLLAPVLILLVRNANYPESALWHGALLATPAIVAFLLPRIAELRERSGRILEMLGILGLCAAACIALPLTLTMGLVLSAILGLGALGHSRRGLAYVFLAQGMASSCALVSFWRPELLYLLAVLPAAVLHAALAYRHRRPIWVTSAAGIGVVGLAGQILGRIHWSGNHAWMIAAAMGVGLLAIASLVDSRRTTVFSRLWAKSSARSEGLSTES